MEASVENTGVSWKLGGGDEAIRRESGCLRDTEEQRTTDCPERPPSEIARAFSALKAELIDLLFQKEVRIAHILRSAPAEHLPDDRLNVLIGDGKPADGRPLDLIDQVALQLLLHREPRGYRAG